MRDMRWRTKGKDFGELEQIDRTCLDCATPFASAFWFWSSSSAPPALHLALPAPVPISPARTWNHHHPRTTRSNAPAPAPAPPASQPASQPSSLVRTRDHHHDPSFTESCHGHIAKIRAPPELGAVAHSPMTGENAPRLTAPAYHPQHQARRPPSPPAQHQQQHQQQQSPLTQLSPSTVKASPQQTPGPLDASSGSAEPSAKRGMRSQIACARCRRSKTKCENTGQGTTCKACANTKRDCIWDHAAAASSSAPPRRDSTADFDAPPKKRRKLLAPTTPGGHRPIEGLGTYEDALQSPLLTPRFVIYEKHFSIDFPFLHKRTFLSSVQQLQPVTTSSDAKTPTQSPVSQPYAPLLLAFLTHTARFHEKLVLQTGNDPIKTAEFYAQATRNQMGAEIFGTPTLEKIQTLLMLGYYEWTALQGREGWIKIGTAIRCAIVLGYPHLDVDHKGQPAPPREGESRLSEKDQFILRETQRRTFWSCCLMDSYLSWGEDRPPMLGPEHFRRTQLVCSDGAFNYGRKSRTRLLGEDDAAYAKRRNEWDSLARHHRSEPNGADRAPQSDGGKWEIGEHEAELTWYIKVVIVFGEVVRWSCNRGRRQEGKTPPWHSSTTFKKLEDKLKQLKRDLPDHLQLTAENTEDRIYNNPGKEYMPTSPWTLPRPQGPLDEPLIDEPPPDPEYWINQAKDCARACSDFTQLLHTIGTMRTHSDSVQTPMVAFACFAVGICTIYCHYFPNMDPDNMLSSRLEPRAHDIANSFLFRILTRFKMARSWLCELAEWQRYYRREKKRYRDCGGSVSDSPRSNNSDGAGGAGLKDYAQLFEKLHKEFGKTVDDNTNWSTKDIDLADTRLSHDEDSAERTLPHLAAVKNERDGGTDDRHNQQEPITTPFTPVNPNSGRTPPVTHTPTYGPQANPYAYHTESTPQHRPPPSPANIPYAYTNSALRPTNMPTGRSQFEASQTPYPPAASMALDTSYTSGWPLNGPVNLNNMNTMKQAIEAGGSHTFDNWSAFSSIMLGDAPALDATPNWTMSLETTTYDNNNNNNNATPCYQPGPGGPGYPYQQQ
ncbi:serine threonine kinase fungal-specific transcription factor [Stemphylium lycopersici]|nr:serine threonine kinase fungal-specific transcription factor [Stemphylium lycopersici]